MATLMLHRHVVREQPVESCPDWLQRLKSLELPGDQKSKEWLGQRQKMLTASDAAAAVGENPYSSMKELIHKKSSDTYIGFTGNDATQWGEYWEDVALQKYCDLYRTNVYALNLVQHPEIPWMGGSPDGVTEEKILIEIKCPPNRQIKPGIEGVPKYYIHQVQMLMYTMDIEMCHFVQFKPKLGGYTYEHFEVAEVPRDPNWWIVYFPKLQLTWDAIGDRRTKLFTGEIVEDVVDETKAKKPKNVATSAQLPCMIVQ